MNARLSELEEKVEGIKAQLEDDEKKGDSGADSATVTKLVADVGKLKEQVGALVMANSLSPEQRRIKAWLEEKVRLPDYFEVFLKNGIDDFSVIALLDKPTLNTIGITSIGHQIKIL